MKKFNWEEFKDKNNKIAVHCKTEEEAKDFCKQMHEHGLKWCSGASYIKKQIMMYTKIKSAITLKGNILI